MTSKSRERLALANYLRHLSSNASYSENNLYIFSSFLYIHVCVPGFASPACVVRSYMAVDHIRQEAVGVQSVSVWWIIYWRCEMYETYCYHEAHINTPYKSVCVGVECLTVSTRPKKFVW